jgi:hypothetical protein
MIRQRKWVYNTYIDVLKRVVLQKQRLRWGSDKFKNLKRFGKNETA